MANLTASLQEHNEFQREQEWRAAGLPQSDLIFSRHSGIDARDVRTFREFSLRGWLLIVRCPKVTARAMHGLFPPKIMAVKQRPAAPAWRWWRGAACSYRITT